MTTAELCRTVRTHFGLSQSHFGTLLGYKKGAKVRVCEIETGKHEPHGAVIILLELAAYIIGLDKNPSDKVLELMRLAKEKRDEQ